MADLPILLRTFQRRDLQLLRAAAQHLLLHRVQQLLHILQKLQLQTADISQHRRLSTAAATIYLHIHFLSTALRQLSLMLITWQRLRERSRKIPEPSTQRLSAILTATSRMQMLSQRQLTSTDFPQQQTIHLVHLICSELLNTELISLFIRLQNLSVDMELRLVV